MGRGGRSLHAAGAGCKNRKGRAAQLSARASRPAQDPAPLVRARRHAADRIRQDPEIQIARAMVEGRDARAMTASPAGAPTGPLSGLRILDISTVVAGPFAATLLADLGAEVLKVEMPGGGDALRRLAPHKDGVPLWWKVTNRNKKGITLDLRKADGKELLGRLVERHDVLVENFRTGTLDQWGITRGWLQGINPRLTILRVTGFGQTGPYRNNPGFARVFEAMSGFTGCAARKAARRCISAI